MGLDEAFDQLERFCAPSEYFPEGCSFEVSFGALGWRGWLTPNETSMVEVHSQGTTAIEVVAKLLVLAMEERSCRAGEVDNWIDEDEVTP